MNGIDWFGVWMEVVAAAVDLRDQVARVQGAGVGFERACEQSGGPHGVSGDRAVDRTSCPGSAGCSGTGVAAVGAGGGCGVCRGPGFGCSQ
jgi:hypothetical protein